MIRFDSDDKENASMKERYEYVYKYGNIAIGNLIFPLELQADEFISDRIYKHIGKQIALEYTPPAKPEDKQIKQHIITLSICRQMREILFTLLSRDFAK